MKKYISIISLSVLLFSCGGGGDDPNPKPDPDPIPENKAPSVPSLASPITNSLCVDNVVEFSWNSSTDPDGDAVSYEVEISTSNQFSENVQRVTISTTSTSVSLEKGTAYYWRVRAKDNKGATSNFSSTYSFYTEGEGESNHLPFAPSLVSPEMNKVVQTGSVTLEWTASDVDSDDTITFDIYFDTVNPPTTKVSENQSELTRVESLESSRTYYWKVIVKDNHGGEAIGQVWTFKTD